MMFLSSNAHSGPNDVAMDLAKQLENLVMN